MGFRHKLNVSFINFKPVGKSLCIPAVAKGIAATKQGDLDVTLRACPDLQSMEKSNTDLFFHFAPAGN